MKLCLIANPNNTYILRWAENFAGFGYQVYLIGEHLLSKRIPDGIRFIDLTQSINIRKLRYIVWGLKIRKIIKIIQPDILHTIGVASAGWLGLFSGYHPRIVTVTGSDLLLLHQRSWLHQYLSIKSLKKADFIFCASKQLKQLVMELGIHESKIGISFFTINQNIFQPTQDPKAAKEKLHLNNLPTITSIRAMQAIYNPLDIAWTIPLVLKQTPNIQFLIFTYHANLDILNQFKSIIEESCASHAVIYVDDLPNDQAIAEYLQASDIVISIPSSDATSLSVLESMACGAAVIASDLSSIREWIVHEEQGVFVPANNIAALSEAIIRLVIDIDFRLMIGRNASKAIKEKIDLDKWINYMDNMYQQIAGLR